MSLIERILARFGRGGQADANVVRVRRQRMLVDRLTRRLSLIITTLFAVGYLWMLCIPSPQLGQGTYIDENALQPSQVSTYWNWADVFRADRYLEQLEGLRDRNSTSEERAQFLAAEFSKLGIRSDVQRYDYQTNVGRIHGVNAYAVSDSPRASGTEAIVISASWLSRTGDGTLNLRGVATVLALAGFLKRSSHWAKDLVFVISDGYLEGMHAWLNAYHETPQNNLDVEALNIPGGVIWNALNIDYPGHSFSHLGIFYEGLNGRLPNQDLLNSFQIIARHTGGVPVVVYDHIDVRDHPEREDLAVMPSWVPSPLRDMDEVKEYAFRAANVMRHVGYQARGRPSGVHGLFHRFRIDAITVFAVPAAGPHGFHAMGRIIESTLRTMNNLLERLHASFFFFMLTGPATFLKIGSYLPSVILISVAMMFSGLREWVNAGWVEVDVVPEKASESSTMRKQWTRRSRPVLRAITIMTASLFVGLALFFALRLNIGPGQITVRMPLLLALGCFPTAVTIITHGSARDNRLLAGVLKALNLCLASTVISVTSLLNFSLAAWLAITLGLPLTLTRPSSNRMIQITGIVVNLSLAGMWILFAPLEVYAAFWHWEVLGVWFAPFVCMVYTPLLLVSATVALLGT